MGDIAFLGLNTLVGGLTAGVLQSLRDGSFQEGFASGALGGAISYGGRRLAVEEFGGAGFLGRQVSAVGGSVVRNASERRPPFARLSLPVGPLIMLIDRAEPVRVRAELDLKGAGWLIAALLDDRLQLDEGATISAGAPVFRTPHHQLGIDGDYKYGVAVAGLVVIGYQGDRPGDHDVFAHERVHVLQYDFVQEIWGDPLETWIGARLGAPQVIRYIRPGLAYGLIRESVANLLNVERNDRIWEIEADYLEHR